MIYSITTLDTGLFNFEPFFVDAVGVFAQGVVFWFFFFKQILLIIWLFILEVESNCRINLWECSAAVS